MLITQSFFTIFKLGWSHVVFNCLFLQSWKRFVFKTFVVRIVILRAINIIVSERYQISLDFFMKKVIELRIGIFEPSVFFIRGPWVFLAQFSYTILGFEIIFLYEGTGWALRNRPFLRFIEIFKGRNGLFVSFFRINITIWGQI